MDFIVNNPFGLVLASCLGVALAFAVAARVTGSRSAATLAAPVVFLVGYAVTYQ